MVYGILLCTLDLASMRVLILQRQRTGLQLLTVVTKQIDCHFISVRSHCICGTQTYSHRKELLSVTSGVTKLQKRHKMQEQQSDIQLWFERKKKIPSNQSLIDDISDGLEIIKKGIPQYKEEWMERLYVDRDIFPEHGDFEYFHRFNGNDSIKNWLVTTDQDTDQGKSTASLTTTSTGTAVFKGYLNTDVPKDGITKRAGYCNIRSPFNKVITVKSS